MISQVPSNSKNISCKIWIFLCDNIDHFSKNVKLIFFLLLTHQHEYYLIAVPSGWYPQNPEAENDQMYFDYNQYYFGNPPCMEDDIEYTVG